MTGTPDEAAERARSLLAEIDRHVPLLTFNRDSGIEPRAICAAGLARSLALVDGIDILEANDREDITGNLVRAVLETHHIALYALLGGRDAVAVLRADHAYFLAALVDSNLEVWGEHGDELTDNVKEWGEQQKMPFWKLRNTLQGLMNDAGERVSLGLWYDLLYRGESTYNVHGLGPLTRYIDMAGNPYTLVLRPSSVAKRGSFVTAALLVGNIAHHLFPAHGIGTRELNSRIDALAQLLVP